MKFEIQHIDFLSTEEKEMIESFGNLELHSFEDVIDVDMINVKISTDSKDIPVKSRYLVELEEQISELEKKNDLKYSDELGILKRDLRMCGAKNTWSYSLLGEYVRKNPDDKPIIILYINTIRSRHNVNLLLIVLIHELMHACYDYDHTQNNTCYKYVEEPLTEYAMLEFIEKNYPALINDAFKHVQDKQNCPPICFYGFGAYLFSQCRNKDWVNMMRKAKYKLPYNSLIRVYESHFNNGKYPSGIESYCADLLDKILKGENTPSNKTTTQQNDEDLRSKASAVLGILPSIVKDDGSLKSILIQNNTESKVVYDFFKNLEIYLPFFLYGIDNPVVNSSNFTYLIDDESWACFMPEGVTKCLFQDVANLNCFDTIAFDYIVESLNRYVNFANSCQVEERIEYITHLIDSFVPAERKTILIPSKMIDSHLDSIADSLAGVSNSSKVLCIDSVTGLYLLRTAYKVWTFEMRANVAINERSIWTKVIQAYLVGLCRNKMSQIMTKKTLDASVSLIKTDIDHILNNIPEFYEYIKKEIGKVSIVLGAPPHKLSSHNVVWCIYPDYVNLAKTLKPAIETMLIPTDWYNGGNRKLSTFKDQILQDNCIKQIQHDDSPLPKLQKRNFDSGVCTYLRDNSHKNATIISYKNGNQYCEGYVTLHNYPFYLKHPLMYSILDKVTSVSKNSMIKVRNGLDTHGHSLIANHVLVSQIPAPGYICCKKPSGVMYVSNYNSPVLGLWKVVIHWVNSFYLINDQGFVKKRLAPEILEPNMICSNHYFILGTFTSALEASNMAAYINTKFVTFLVVMCNNVKQRLSNIHFNCVPLQNFNQCWNDTALYKKYGLTTEEINYIETVIK